MSDIGRKDIGGGSGGVAAVWGGITGNIDNQSDLINKIDEARLANQIWLPAVQTKSALPTVEDTAQNYLCRVIADATASNNGVWQWIGGGSVWTYFSDNLDFIDETELDEAIDAHNTDNTAHADIRTAVNGKASPSDIDTKIAAHNTNGSTHSDIRTAIAAKADASALTAHMGNTSNPHNTTAAQVGLGNVNNTSDANKPISTATQTALNGKQASLNRTVQTNLASTTAAADTGGNLSAGVSGILPIANGGTGASIFPIKVSTCDAQIYQRRIILNRQSALVEFQLGVIVIGGCVAIPTGDTTNAITSDSVYQGLTVRLRKIAADERLWVYFDGVVLTTAGPNVSWLYLSDTVSWFPSATIASNFGRCIFAVL